MMMKLIARPVPTPREHVSGHYAKPPASGQFKLSESCLNNHSIVIMTRVLCVWQLGQCHD